MKWTGEAWTGLLWTGLELVCEVDWGGMDWIAVDRPGACECGYEHSRSIKCGKFLD